MFPPSVFNCIEEERVMGKCNVSSDWIKNELNTARSKISARKKSHKVMKVYGGKLAKMRD